jgi:hypothetical protein
MTGLMQGALWYTGSGVVALAICRLISWARQRKEERSTFLRDVIAAMEPPRPRWVRTLKTLGGKVVAEIVIEN